MEIRRAERYSPVASVLGERSDRPQTATDYVSEAMRRSILSGDLKSGTKLSLSVLASSFGVSTTPVREALRELAHEGLVTLDSYRGGVVTDVTEADVEEIVRIRTVLEPLAIREAVAGMTSEILDEARAILDEMGRSDRWEVWVQGNRAFHQKLYEAAESKRLVSLIRTLQNTQVVFVSARLRHSTARRVRATEEHEALFEAARAGDAERMIEITLGHLRIPLGDTSAGGSRD